MTGSQTCVLRTFANANLHFHYFTQSSVTTIRRSRTVTFMEHSKFYGTNHGNGQVNGWVVGGNLYEFPVAAIVLAK